MKTKTTQSVEEPWQPAPELVELPITLWTGKDQHQDSDPDGRTHVVLQRHRQYEALDDYAEAMRAGAVFPPITVFYDGQSYWLADGYHRVLTADRIGRATLLAEVHQGSEREATLWAAKHANLLHGVRRSNMDKHQIVQTFLHDPEWVQWSDHRIAEQCAVSQPFVSTVRAEFMRQEQARQRVEEARRTREARWQQQDTEGATDNAYQSSPLPSRPAPPRIPTRVGIDGRTYHVENIGRRSGGEPEPELAVEDVENEEEEWDEEEAEEALVEERWRPAALAGQFFVELKATREGDEGAWIKPPTPESITALGEFMAWYPDERDDLLKTLAWMKDLIANVERALAV